MHAAKDTVAANAAAICGWKRFMVLPPDGKLSLRRVLLCRQVLKDLNAKAARAWPISGTAHRRTPTLELATARCHPSSRLSWPTRRALTIILKSGKSGVLFVNSRKTAWYPLEDAVTSNSVTRKGTEMEWEEALLVAWGAEMPQQPAEYYRRKATRARQMAAGVTTRAMKTRLLDEAGHYDELASTVDRLARDPTFETQTLEMAC